MKDINAIKQRVEEQTAKASEDNFYIALCGGNHPLTDFIVEFYSPEYKDKVIPLTEDNLVSAMREYMVFAWEKARGGRGISSDRSIWKFRQWLWALEDEELHAFACNEMNYPMYGKPILRAICEKYHFPM